jgi:acetyl esterase/lipase
MCPACLATLAMMIAGASSTGGLAAVLIHKFRVKKGVKKMVGIGKSEWIQAKEKES